MSENRLTLYDAMKQAVAAHNAGELAKAERLYKAVLAAKPDHANALHLLGTIESLPGRNANAVRLTRRRSRSSRSFSMRCTIAAPRSSG